MKHTNGIAIALQGLTKRFDKLEAVAGISLNVYEGELFGFLGPNGAGKTTTVRMLTGVLAPDGGTAQIQEHDIRREPVLSRAHLAVVPEEANVYRDLSVWQNILLMAELYGIPRRQRMRSAERLLEKLQLLDRKHQKARALSKGLRQRLMLCAALVTEPDILFLDEPTSGLDVHSTRLIRKLVRELNHGGLTVFLTTHNMGEAEDMCSRVAIINAGKIVVVDTPKKLRSAMQSSQYVELRLREGNIDMPVLQQLPGVSRMSKTGNTLRLYTPTPGLVAEEVGQLVRTQGLSISHICTCRASLEDVFVYFTSTSETDS